MSPFVEVLVVALLQELPSMSESLTPEDFKRVALARFEEVVSVAPAYDVAQIKVAFKECREFYDW